MKKSGQDTGSRASQGVTQRNGTSQRVDLGVLKTQDLGVGQDDTGESLVELPNSDLFLGDSSTLQSDRDSLGGGDREVNGGHGSISVADNSGQDAGIATVLLSNLLVAQNKSASSVVKGRRVGGSDGAGAVTDKGRLQGGDLLELDVQVPLVSVDDDLALAVLNGNGGDFVSKGLVSPSFLCVAVRLDGVFVLLLTGDVVLLDSVLAAVAHVELGVDISQPILDQAVLELGVSKGRKAARAVDVVRNLGHVLHATGDLGLSKTKLDVLRSESDGLETRRAHLVDGDGLDALRNTGEDGSLASGSLANRGRQDIAHVDIGNLLDRDLGLLKGGLDGDSSKLGSRDVKERAVELCAG